MKIGGERERKRERMMVVYYSSAVIILLFALNVAACCNSSSGFGFGYGFGCISVSAFTMVVPYSTITSRSTTFDNRVSQLHYYDWTATGSISSSRNDSHNKGILKRRRTRQSPQLSLSTFDDDDEDNNSSCNSPNNIVIMDWECLLDSLPYHVNIGIYSACKLWPHLNALCNFDTDSQWLKNKLYSISHVLSYPNNGQQDNNYHLGCEFALATRLILEEQALDKNQSTGKKGKYARKYHPRTTINGNSNGGKGKDDDSSRQEEIDEDEDDDEQEEEDENEDEDEDDDTIRPLTVGELSINWREYIRETLLIKYAVVVNADGKKKYINPLEELDEIIEEYVLHSKIDDDFLLPLFSQTKFALRNTASDTSTKIIVRVPHEYDNNIVTKSFASQRIVSSSSSSPEKILCSNDHNSIAILLKHEEDDCNNDENNNDDITCLREIMKLAAAAATATNTNTGQQQQQTIKTETETEAEIVIPSIIWIDNSWNRLRSLVPAFGDSMPGQQLNNSSNKAKCDVQWLTSLDNNNNNNNDNINDDNNDDAAAVDNDKNGSDNNINSDNDNNEKLVMNSSSVWLSLYLAEWPATSTEITTTASTATRTRTNNSSNNKNNNNKSVVSSSDSGSSSSSSSNPSTTSTATTTAAAATLSSTDLLRYKSSYHEDSMVYPWTDLLSWNDAEDIIIPNIYGGL